LPLILPAKLKKSAKNARRMPHAPVDIQSLAAIINHHGGMLQYPVVEPETVKGRQEDQLLSRQCRGGPPPRAITSYEAKGDQDRLGPVFS
jgi:hypothetical protein